MYGVLFEETLELELSSFSGLLVGRSEEVEDAPECNVACKLDALFGLFRRLKFPALGLDVDIDEERIGLAARSLPFLHVTLSVPDSSFSPIGMSLSIKNLLSKTVDT